jgi:hypothetical protein
MHALPKSAPLEFERESERNEALPPSADWGGAEPTGAVVLQQWLAAEIDRGGLEGRRRLRPGIGLGLSALAAVGLWVAVIKGGMIVASLIAHG